MGISVGNIIPFNPDIIMRIVRKKGGNMIRDKFLKNKRIKKLLASMAVFVSAVCVSTAVSGFTTQVYAEATIGTNISVSCLKLHIIILPELRNTPVLKHTSE